VENLNHGKSFLILILVFLVFQISEGETTKDRSVQIHVNIIDSPKPKIKLSWTVDTNAQIVSISKKVKIESGWHLLRTMSKDSGNITDEDVIPGIGYEYYIKKLDSSYEGFGYVYAGTKIPFEEYRGELLLLVDRTITDSLTYELERFERDLTGDGWLVKRIEVPRTEKFNSEAVVKIKKLIEYEYRNSDYELKSLILFGRVAVPYSGNASFDGHFPSHYGAWPSDVYYGVMNGKWTDITSNTTTAERPENWNLPFDGKYDQSMLNDACVLQIGRIDFYNLPNFPQTEIELYRRYLNKNHNFRNKQFSVNQKAFIDDGFGMSYGTPYATAAWMAFADLVGPDSIETGAYVPGLSNSSYIWSYGCNQGGYNSMLLTLYTDQLTKMDINGVFTMYLGSFLGDFDSQDNLMRAACASNPSILVSFWGLPFWILHQMSLGETIGYQAKLTQNNDNIYQTSYRNSLKGIHIALMGDPTLRMHLISPVKHLSLEKNPINNGVSKSLHFRWDASEDNIIGYNIYKSKSLGSKFIRLNESPHLSTEYTDTITNGEYFQYMVRVVKLQMSPTGSYFNQSQGVFIDSEGLYDFVNNNTENNEITVVPNPASQFLNISSNSVNFNNSIISVYDLTGQIIRQFRMDYENTSNILTWDLKDKDGDLVNNGIYMLRVQNNYNIIQKLFIVLKDN